MKGVLGIPILVSVMILATWSGTEPVSANTGACIKAKFTGVATTYNPNVSGWKTGGQVLATGGRYNPDGWEAALQLDLAKQYGCGYGSRKTCHAAVEGNGKAMIVLINNNGPMCADPATAARAKDCIHRTSRVIDLNEKAMRYMSDGRYGNNSGTIPNVTVTLLCDFNAKLGPLDEKEHAAWKEKSFGVPVTDVSSPHPVRPESTLVGGPTPAGFPAQSAYRQPADYSNYHSPSPTQVSPYFSPQQQGTGGFTLPQTPIYRSSSNADALLSLIGNTTASHSTTTPLRRVTVTPVHIGRVATSTTSSDTIIVTPLTPPQPPQTFAPAVHIHDQTPLPVVGVLADMVRQLQMIFERIVAFFRGS